MKASLSPQGLHTKSSRELARPKPAAGLLARPGFRRTSGLRAGARFALANFTRCSHMPLRLEPPRVVRKLQAVKPIITRGIA